MRQSPLASEDIEVLRKKLIYRSWHRGTREMDLILGRFADAKLLLTDEVGLHHYANMLNESDPDLYDWITGAAQAPAAFASLIMCIKESCCC